MAAVVTQGLRRSFAERDVLRSIDLEIAPGEFVALLGRSGSGKSTLLRILAGLDRGAEGTIWVPERRAVVFQDPRLLPWRSVLANVVLGLRGRGAEQQGRRALHEVGLDGHEYDWPRPCQGARPNEWPWPGRSSANPTCCCWTSPSARSTRSPG